MFSPFSNDLFVFDIANNHQGSVDHGINIIKEFGKVAKEKNVKCIFKFQFRDLATLIHPEFINSTENKHIKRFTSTKLKVEDYQILLDEVKNQGLLSMCTPFDEKSVDRISEMGFDFINVASCCATDWPLLKKISEAFMPTVISTGGLKIKEIDNLVSFFNHKGNDFALMHCVSVYPSEDNELSLNQIDLFKNRYSKIPIGWSTHEHPYNTTAVAIAKSKGASLFERHVGLNTEEISLNLYSSTPEQAGEWIDSYISASKMCGDGLNRTHPENEQHSLEILKRGVYLKDDIEMGEYLTKDKVFFAMPLQENQLDSGTWNEKIEVRKSLKINDPILKNSIKIPDNNKGHKILKEAIHEIKALLNEASIVLNSEFDIEFSHHYGKEKFFKVGTFIVNCINRDYCKKILVQLPGQKHPVHYHLKKEETFQVLYGCLETITEGQRRTLHPGQTLLIQPGVWHSFWSDQGCVFEEVSTTHFNNDSIYNDKKINDMKREDRKTTATNWGRFTIND